jgi:hypothetical protein
MGQIEGNPIKSQEMLRKYKFGSDHLVDFLEKRLIGMCSFVCSDDRDEQAPSRW